MKDTDISCLSQAEEKILAAHMNKVGGTVAYSVKVQKPGIL